MRGSAAVSHTTDMGEGLLEASGIETLVQMITLSGPGSPLATPWAERAGLPIVLMIHTGVVAGVRLQAAGGGGERKQIARGGV